MVKLTFSIHQVLMIELDLGLDITIQNIIMVISLAHSLKKIEKQKEIEIVFSLIMVWNGI